jgi:hypothetical protein
VGRKNPLQVFRPALRLRPFDSEAQPVSSHSLLQSLANYLQSEFTL